MSQHVNFHILKVSLLASCIGILAGIAAEALHRLIGLVTNVAFYQHFSTHIVSPLDSPLGVFMIFVPAIGGLIVGIMAKYGTSLVRGHGIPEAMEAILLKRSRIHPKVALLKPLSAGISLGSGQPFGAEGPIIQTGAAIGSLLGQLFRTTSTERKVLLACGAAAGLAATFGTPVAAIIFALELLLFEFRTRSFIPLVIASTVAAEMHIVILGPEPVFSIGAISFGSPRFLFLFLILGIISGGVAIGLTKALYWLEDMYHRIPISHYLYPAIGGLFVGIVGYVVPHTTYSQIDVFGPGYYVIENILSNQYAAGFLLILLLSKASVWLVALGSGTSGGTLAPIFMVGAAAGGIFGLFIQRFFPQVEVTPAAFALAGMAAVFGSSTRATFASIVFAFEMTRSYEALLPVMFTCVIADLIAAHFTNTSILTEQLRRSGVLVHHEYEAERLGMIRVEEVMGREPILIARAMTVNALADRLSQHDPDLTRHHGFIIVDDDQHMVSIMTYGDIQKALRENKGNQPVSEVGTCNPITAVPRDTVYDAMLKMWKNDIGRLPIVDSNDKTLVIGYLSRTQILKAYFGRLHEDEELEAGWVDLQFARLAGERFQGAKLRI